MELIDSSLSREIVTKLKYMTAYQYVSTDSRVLREMRVDGRTYQELREAMRADIVKK